MWATRTLRPGAVAYASRFYGLRTFSQASEALAENLANVAGDKKPGLSVLLLFFPCAATFGLGTWQLMRREWKIELLDNKREKFAEEPVMLGDILLQVANNVADGEEDMESPLEYRRVVCEGVFDESKSIFIGPRLKKIGNASQRGYLVVTPLYPVPNSNDSTSFLQPPVLVNRGWIPHDWREDFGKTSTTPDLAAAKPVKYNRGAWWKIWERRSPSPDSVSEAEQTKGFVKVCGVVRGSEDPNVFVPLNSPETGQWFYVDVPLMAKTVGLPESTPYVEVIGEASRDDEFPVPKTPEEHLRTSLMPNDHLNYALTWYTLSAATTYMAVRRIKQNIPSRKIPVPRQ